MSFVDKIKKGISQTPISLVNMNTSDASSTKYSKFTDEVSVSSSTHGSQMEIHTPLHNTKTTQYGMNSVNNDTSYVINIPRTDNSSAITSTTTNTTHSQQGGNQK